MSAKLINIAARLAAVLWDDCRICPECGCEATHLPSCKRTYPRLFKGPQDCEGVFKLAFGIADDSKVLQELDAQWQKMLLVVLWKFSKKDKVEDIKALTDAFAPGAPVIYTHGHADSIDFQVVDEATALILSARSRS